MAESNAEPGSGTSWERDALERLARAALDEQRRARRWGIFFKSLTFLYLFILLFVFLGLFGGKDGGLPGRHTALVGAETLAHLFAPDDSRTG